MSVHSLWSFPPFSTAEESVGEVLAPTYSWNNWTILASASDVPHPDVLGHWALSSQCHLQRCLGIWQEGALPSLHQDITNGYDMAALRALWTYQACLTVEFPAWVHMSGSMQLPSQSRVPLAVSGASTPNLCKAQRRKQPSSPSLRSTFKGPFSVSFKGNPILQPQDCDLDLWPNWAITLQHSSPTIANFSQRLT